MPIGGDFAAVDRQLTVDEQIVDTLRVCIRLLVCGYVTELGGIEDENVSIRTLTQKTAITNTQNRRRQTG